MRTIGLICIGLVAAACGNVQGDQKQQQPPPKVTVPPPGPPEPVVVEPAKEHMKEHFIRVGALRDAVIAGDLAATRDPAAWLAEHGAPANIPDPWIRHVTDLKVIAGEARDAKDLAGVATAVGALGRSCGSCHEDLGYRLSYQIPPEPTTSDKKTDHMQRHAWAAERMWDGLFVPSDEAWSRGAAVFFDAPLFDSGAGPQDPRRGLAKRVHVLGESAAGLDDPIARGALYGDLIATCAGCHEATDGGN